MRHAHTVSFSSFDSYYAGATATQHRRRCRCRCLCTSEERHRTREFSVCVCVCVAEWIRNLVSFNKQTLLPGCCLFRYLKRKLTLARWERTAQLELLPVDTTHTMHFGSAAVMCNPDGPLPPIQTQTAPINHLSTGQTHTRYKTSQHVRSLAPCIQHKTSVCVCMRE